MIVRRDSLAQVLTEIEAGALQHVRAVVVSRRWRDTLSSNERDAYRVRSERHGVRLRVDNRISTHMVEAQLGGDEGPLSTEQPV